ncbi:MAG: hypothetical protein Q7U40_11775 [Desulfatirhabdiaceae bacterium]|nr:hypothetical protein [Desulfatirhabdiaceae bacterium]
MDKTAFLRIEFYLLVVFSLLLPSAIYFQLIIKRIFSRITMFLLGLAMIMMSGVDLVLLQKLSAIAVQSSDLADDVIFGSEFSMALYLLPLILAGLGINVISHILHSHMVIAELEPVNPGEFRKAGKGDR